MENRILFATDVPFWQMSTGAEQRMFAINRFLVNEGCRTGVFYLGELSQVDHDLVQQFKIEIFANSSTLPPEKLVNRVRWYADASINQARSWLARDNDGDIAVDDGPPSLTLDDFAWPWAVTNFKEVVDSFKPDSIIFEYIKMSYLLDALSTDQRSNIRCLVDTHDVLHKRAAQFFAHGFPHWLKIDRQSESDVLRKFDAIIAIQDKEAEEFREMTDSTVETITVGHAVDGNVEFVEPKKMEPPPNKITVGYIGSKNFSNWQAIREFLICAWPSVVMKNQATCSLTIAGAICDWFDTDADGNLTLACDRTDLGVADNTFSKAQKTAFEKVNLLGRVDCIEDFYDTIDLVINPVEFGTGLKIKNAESLRFGKLLITTTNGFDGMPETTRLACMVVENVDEMGLAINSICNDLSLIRPMQTLALQLAQTEFSASHAYSELKRYLSS